MGDGGGGVPSSVLAGWLYAPCRPQNKAPIHWEPQLWHFRAHTCMCGEAEGIWATQPAEVDSKHDLCLLEYGPGGRKPKTPFLSLALQRNQPGHCENHQPSPPAWGQAEPEKPQASFFLHHSGPPLYLKPRTKSFPARLCPPLYLCLCWGSLPRGPLHTRAPEGHSAATGCCHHGHRPLPQQKTEQAVTHLPKARLLLGERRDPPPQPPGTGSTGRWQGPWGRDPDDRPGFPATLSAGTPASSAERQHLLPAFLQVFTFL